MKIRFFLLVVFLLSSFMIKAQGVNIYDGKGFPDMWHFIGTHFPIEELQNSNGAPYSPDYLKGKTTFVNFWSTNCAPCIEELPLLSQLKEELTPDVAFLAVTFNKKDQVENFLLKHRFDFEHITDMNPKLVQSFARRQPTSFIIDENGNIQKIFPRVDKDFYDRIKQQILNVLKKKENPENPLKSREIN